MKFRYIVIAGVMSCSLGSLAWGQGAQEQTPPSPPQQGQSVQSGGQAQGMPSSRDEVVRQVQQTLNDQGFNAGPVDGKWGPKTQSAVKNFQQAKGLQPTGELDQETLAELNIEGQGAVSRGEAGQPGAGTAAGAAEKPEQGQQPGGMQEEEPAGQTR
ncbi:MAG TPA: peptidoglycan-binding domain-containing protein [Burkholderiales bacterium]